MRPLQDARCLFVSLFYLLFIFSESGFAETRGGKTYDPGFCGNVNLSTSALRNLNTLSLQYEVFDLAVSINMTNRPLDEFITHLWKNHKMQFSLFDDVSQVVVSIDVHGDRVRDILLELGSRYGLLYLVVSPDAVEVERVLIYNVAVEKEWKLKESVMPSE